MFKKIVDTSYIRNELALHELFKELGIEKYFLPPLKIEPNALYFKKLTHDFHSYYATISNKNKFWPGFLYELSSIISILEKHHIQHNDLHMGNLMFDGKQLKIIDLEMMTNYGSIPPRFSNYTPAEKYRLGLANVFHIGADMNQILGYIFEEYKNDIPAHFAPLKQKIIVLNKEFPYAISTKNNKTSGSRIIHTIGVILQQQAKQRR